MLIVFNIFFELFNITRHLLSQIPLNINVQGFIKNITFYHTIKVEKDKLNKCRDSTSDINSLKNDSQNIGSTYICRIGTYTRLWVDWIVMALCIVTSRVICFRLLTRCDVSICMVLWCIYTLPKL